jgi:hypothetical protein
MAPLFNLPKLDLPRVGSALRRLSRRSTGAEPRVPERTSASTARSWAARSDARGSVGTTRSCDADQNPRYRCWESPRLTQIRRRARITASTPLAQSSPTTNSDTWESSAAIAAPLKTCTRSAAAVAAPVLGSTGVGLASAASRVAKQADRTNSVTQARSRRALSRPA